jgi:hypothetical protein
VYQYLDGKGSLGADPIYVGGPARTGRIGKGIATFNVVSYLYQKELSIYASSLCQMHQLTALNDSDSTIKL